MIDDSLKMFLNYDLKNAIQEKFYGSLFDQLEYVLKILIKGQHSKDNELQCVGSQSLHLYYVPTNDVNTHFIVYRNEQHSDTIFKLFIYRDYRSLTVYKGYDKFTTIIKGNQKVSINDNGEIVFKSLEDLHSLIRWNKETLTKEAASTDEILDGKSNHSIFSITQNGNDVPLILSNSYYSFPEQLEIFGLMNTMLCGVQDGEPPKKFFKIMGEASKMMAKLKNQLPKTKYD